jgi:hypothetical protein
VQPFNSGEGVEPLSGEPFGEQRQELTMVARWANWS